MNHKILCDQIFNSSLLCQDFLKSISIENSVINPNIQTKNITENITENIIDLQNYCLYPGLINAHAHLELTLDKPLENKDNFISWIQSVIHVKNNFSKKEKENCIQRGIQQSLAGGATFVADHVSFDTDIELLLQSPLRSHLFLESISVHPELSLDIHNKNLASREKYRNYSPIKKISCSPHSIHALHPNTLDSFSELSSSLLSIHLLESQEELQFFRELRGPMYDFIKQADKNPSRAANSPLRILEKSGLLDRHQILAIHSNFLGPLDIKILQKYNISVVHCPSSHDYFQHAVFPLRALQEAQINIALGTDSLASSSSISMLETLKIMQGKWPQLSKEEIFKMATLGGAQALGLENEIGSIQENKKADLIAIHNPKQLDPIDLIFKADKVDWMMINGKIIYMDSRSSLE